MFYPSREDPSIDDFESIINYAMYYLSMNYSSCYKNAQIREDLIQEIAVVLCQMLPKFDSSKSSLKTYIQMGVKRGITLYSIKLRESSEEDFKVHRRIEKAKNFFLQHNIDATPENIGGATNITTTRAQSHMYRPSNENIIHDEEFYLSIPDTNPCSPNKNPENIVEAKNAVTQIINILTELPPEERKLLQDFFNYLDNGNKESTLPPKTRGNIYKAQAHARAIRDKKSYYATTLRQCYNLLLNTPQS